MSANPTRQYKQQETESTEKDKVMFQSAVSVDPAFPNETQQHLLFQSNEEADRTSNSWYLLVESPGATFTTDKLSVAAPVVSGKNKDPQSLVDSMEIEVVVRQAGPGTTLEHPQPMRRSPSPWCWCSTMDSSRQRLCGGTTTMRRQQQTGTVVDGSSSELSIDPASIASLYHHPEGIVGNRGQNPLENPSKSSSGVWTNPTRLYPDATPLEWQRVTTPVTQSNKRVAELAVEDAAAKPPRKRLCKRTVAATADPSTKRRTNHCHGMWQRKFELLCAFQRENGHCRVHKSYIVDSVQLGHWVRNQRKFYVNYMEGKHSPITKERISLLNSIGFEWRRADTWQRKFERLCVFQRENGHCRVPQSYIVDSVKLGQWVQYQRKYYKNREIGKEGDTSISSERIAQLNSIGFDWRVDETTKSDTWPREFELLCAFQRENGHCRVPKSYIADSVKLGIWVKNQKRNCQIFEDGTKGDACTSRDRIAQLSSIGFEWKPKQITQRKPKQITQSKPKQRTKTVPWQQKFALLCAFQRENGHCQVPQRYIVDSVKLGRWANFQRHCYYNDMEGKHATIIKEHISQLNSIGFEWRVNAPTADSETTAHA